MQSCAREKTQGIGAPRVTCDYPKAQLMMPHETLRMPTRTSYIGEIYYLTFQTAPPQYFASRVSKAIYVPHKHSRTPHARTSIATFTSFDSVSNESAPAPPAPLPVSSITGKLCCKHRHFIRNGFVGDCRHRSSRSLNAPLMCAICFKARVLASFCRSNGTKRSKQSPAIAARICLQ